MSNTLNQYEAAALLSISPELLKYCGSYAVKTGDLRKLVGKKGLDSLMYYEEEDLLSYDKYLREVWPSKNPGDRPHLPDFFKHEIKTEASGECALCLANSNSCEAAHIAAVHRSKCNHPHNLVWLCANHHTKFDKGFIGPREDLNEFVKAQKTVLRERRRLSWMAAGDVASNIATLLKLAGAVPGLFKTAKLQNKEIAARVAENILQLIPEVLSHNHNDSLKPILDKVSATLNAVSEHIDAKPTALDVLEEVGSYEAEFVDAAGLKTCPLCKGSRWHRENTCPVCQGDGVVSDSLDYLPELFDSVECQVCSGSGRRDDEICPACGGEGDMDAYVADGIDWVTFDKVECRLCAGSGRRDGDDCPACGGQGELDDRHAQRTDWDSYDSVDCRLCGGSGRDGDWNDCRACHGNRKMEIRFDREFEWSGFEKVRCRLCEGSGRGDYGDCPACCGNKEMYAIDAERIDWASFNDVKCPRCLGEGNIEEEDCPECLGTGKREL